MTKTALISVCIVALFLLVLTVWITCWTQDEDERESVFGERKSCVGCVLR